MAGAPLFLDWSKLQVLDVTLGSGRSSVVKLGRSPDGTLCAVKVFHSNWCTQHRDYVVREVLHHQAISVFKHPFVVELRGVTAVGSPAQLALVLEYCEGVLPLDKFQEQHGGVLPIHVARRLFQQLVIAVDFCHRLGKANRDLKLCDMLVDISTGDVQLKLCDFSFAKDKVIDSEAKTQLGTVLFTAPEIVTAVPGAVYDGALADVWSLGVVLSTVLFGQHPFLHPDDAKLSVSDQIYRLINNSVSGRLQIPSAAASQHPEAYDLLQQLLRVDPKKRPTTDGIMRHPFFRNSIPTEWLTLNESLLMEQCRNGSEATAPVQEAEVQALVDRVSRETIAAQAASTTSSQNDKLMNLFKEFSKAW